MDMGNVLGIMMPEEPKDRRGRMLGRAKGSNRWESMRENSGQRWTKVGDIPARLGVVEIGLEVVLECSRF